MSTTKKKKIANILADLIVDEKNNLLNEYLINHLITYLVPLLNIKK